MSICVENVSYIYGKGTPFERAAIEDIDLTIDKGEFIGIIGHTGSGKSTLIQHLNGLLHPSVGKVTVDGVDLAEKTKEAMVKRHSVGMVFQYPEHQLFEESVYEDISFGPRNQGLSDAEVERRVRESMELTRLPDSYRDRSPFALSGGERRRVAIAGVLALAPRYLVLDEPAAGLDPRGREALLTMLTMLHRERGVSVILVSHSMEDILRVANHMVILAGGRVIGEGIPCDLFRQEELLTQAALAAPHILCLGRKLEAAGYPVGDCMTVADMAAKILAKSR